MPFVHKDADGKILAVYTEPVEGGVEVAPDDPALRTFIHDNIPDVDATQEWVQSDLGLARVMEDMIDILVQKKVILFTDFPLGAQKKLLERRGRREEFSIVEDLFGGNDDDDDSYGGEGGEGFL